MIDYNAGIVMDYRLKYYNFKRKKMKDNEIMVSVIMPVYNHEKYLREAIESVICQKVNFAYELLIGEDKSTDNSLEIIREYEKKYPEIIRVFAREKNMGALLNGYDLYKNTRGKYITTLEGDDFWLETCKLQMQLDFLESNPEYIACAHRFRVVDQEGNGYFDRDFECQFFQDNPYTKEILEKGLMLSHVNTLMFRNIFMDNNINTDFWIEFDNSAGDYTLHALLILNGKMYFINECYSCYRKVVNKESSSFSSLQERNNKRDALYKSALDLEEILNKEYKFNCIARKKNTFASAVFKWYREKNRFNYNVIINIIKMSKKPLLYTWWFAYLFFCRLFLDLIGKKDCRVAF